VRGRLLSAIAALAAAWVLPAPAESIFGRQGLGEWIEAYDLRAEGTGGVAVAVRDSFPHSQLNPAAFAFASRSSGYVSLYPEVRWIRREEAQRGCPEGLDCGRPGTERQNSGRLGSLHGVVAAGQSVRFAFGLRQATDPSYQTVNTIDGQTVRKERGTGGLVAYSLGAAWRARPGLALGIEGGLVAGTMKDIVTFDFAGGTLDDTRDEIATRIKNAFCARAGALWTAGRLSLGSFYASAASGDGERVWRSASGLEAKEGFEQELPASAGFGAAWQLAPRVRVAADAVWRGWSGVSSASPDDGSLPAPEDTWRFAAGLERVGRMSPQAGFGEAIAWRVGAGYDTWPTQSAGGKRVREAALSAGMGLPIARDRGRVEVLVRLGRRSLEETSRPHETVLRIGIGATYGSMPRGY
jgi:hypothetical protein